MAVAGQTPLDAGAERAKELYKYFQPQTFIAEHAGDQPRSTDPLLTSQAQLVALRLNARRCTISFLDHNTQYNVAEATQSMRLDDTTKHDTARDGLWKGCSSFSSESSMCLHTLVAKSEAVDEPPCFEVLDVGSDPRFAKLPFVHDYPYIRYYYGAPMQTSRGVVIGSLCVLDDKIRPPMTGSEKLFLEAVARNVILYMELQRDRAEQQRSVYMSKCLAAFVDPDHSPLRVNGQPMHMLSGPKTPTTTVPPAVTPFTPMTDTNSAHPATQATRALVRPRLQRKGSSMRTYEGAADGAGRRRALSVNKQLQNQMYTFQYAANLLRESVSDGAGATVVIYDTAMASSRRTSGPMPPEGAEPGSEDDWSSDSAPAHASHPHSDRHTTSTAWSSHHGNSADVLAFSEPAAPERARNASQADVVDHTFQPMALKRLAQFVERYPRGKFWTFNSDGQPYSESSDDSRDDTSNDRAATAKSDRDQAEVSLLLHHFPNALQVIFVPFWDLRCSRWCAAFVTNSSPYRTFTSHADFLYVIAFCNCIAIELARAATEASDQQKSDFIGSISHELRSPLHGIMASCEFLQDTETSTFQQSLLDTVDSCARTLLDTISMVLDYSKINTFERDWRKAQRPKRGGGKIRTDRISRRSSNVPDSQPSMNIYGNIDLGGVTEEVVEGAVTGHAVQSLSSKLGLDMGVAGPTRDGLLHPASVTTTTFSNGQLKPSHEGGTDAVEVVLDIASREWSYLTQPGAFRRIVMNLVGNALKYTSRGWIKVKLCVVEDDGSTPDDTLKASAAHDERRDMVELCVTDTGRGISQEYLRSKLFTPFSQEDQLAPGTGLGLSLVKSIVNLLEGEIEVQSTLNMGTKVTVRIPMIPQGTAGDSPHVSSGSSSENIGTVQARLESIRAVRTDSQGKEIALFAATPLDATHTSISHERMRLQRESLKKYLVNWYGIRISSQHSVTATTDVVVVDEADLEHVMASTAALTQPPPILVLCSNSARHKYMSEQKFDHLDFLSKPFGPYRLAKALHHCLQKAQGTSTETTQPRSTGADSVEALHADVEKVTLATDDGNIAVLKSRSVLGNQQSPNAQMALSRGTSDDARDARNPLSAHVEPASALGTEQNPFDAAALGSLSRLTSPAPPTRPPLTTRKTLSPTTTELAMTSAATAAAATATATSHLGVAATIDAPLSTNSTTTATATATTTTATTPARTPRLLLVDDNAINLRLLQTFMHKRKYTFVDSASDGAEAVQRFAAAAAAHTPYDVVFMDISMPVMNGFEATQRIRAIEDARATATPAMDMPAPALVIALTGLASGRDQSEAFVAGVDLYMTKPVSFREIARLLDNWEANGGTASGDAVPHGAVSGADVVPGHEG